MLTQINNDKTKPESNNESKQLFGQLRNLTKEELHEQQKTIDKISKKTGINFFKILKK